MRSRWPEYVIALCVIGLGIAGALAIWGDDAETDEAGTGAETSISAPAATSGGGRA